MRCISPDGPIIGGIIGPEKVAEVCVGGPARNRPDNCGHTSLHAIPVDARGASAP